MARPPELSFRTRARNLETLARESFDLLVIGGGITGAGIARDAALRGLRVALVERRDFAVGTSSRSSKLIHGGLRYLPQGDVGLVMEAANERRVLRRLAPHLARPIQLLYPVHSRSGYAKLSAGLWTYDRMARVLKDERNQMLGRDETLALEPSLRSDTVYGAALYYEYLTDDARLVVENIKSAAALGAVVTNHAEVTGLLTDGGRLHAAVVRDATSGAELAVRAKIMVNAAGPWVDAVRLLQGDGERPRLHLTKGIHLVVPRERLNVSRIVVMNTPDRRSVFVVPRRSVAYLGTTDTDYEGRYDDPAITLDDVHYLLDAANATFAVDRLGLDDVVGAWAGLRPLLHQEGKKPTELSRKDEVMVGPTGLISIAGGKLTTYRKMAERVTDLVVEHLKAQGQTLPATQGDSEHESLTGGETGDDVDGFTTRMKQRWPHVPEDIVDRLVTVYGASLRLPRAAAVSISQSGRSPDIVEMQRLAHKAGATTIAMVNEVDSPLATEAEELLPLMAGREQSVAATKSMIAGMAAGAALVAAWRGDPSLRDAIAGVPALLPAQSPAPPSELVERLARAEHAFALGRGATFAVATEAALKLKETCAIHAEAYSSAEVLHGPAELARPGFLVIAFMPSDAGREGMEMTLRLLGAAGADVVRVEAGGDDAKDRLTCAPAASPLLTPIAMIHRFYGLAEAVSRRLGRNPDRPRNLHKVTETV